MRQVFRWGVRHGLIRWSSTRGASKGEVAAALIIDPAYALDPFEHYETIRAKGPLYDNGFALTTVSHAVSTAVLRSPDFGVMGGYGGNVPRWLLLAQAIGGAGPPRPGQPPAMPAGGPPPPPPPPQPVPPPFPAPARGAL